MNRRSFAATLTAVLLAPLCVSQGTTHWARTPRGVSVAKDVEQMVACLRADRKYAPYSVQQLVPRSRTQDILHTIASATGIPYPILVGEPV